MYNLNDNALSDAQLAKIFFHPVGCIFTCLTVSFDVQKLCKVMTTHYSVIGILSWAAGLLPIQQVLPCTYIPKCFPCFFSLIISEHLVHSQVAVAAWVSIWLLYFILINCVSVLYQCHADFVTVALQCNLKSGTVISLVYSSCSVLL